jgi:chromosome segregation ATPase
VVERKKIEMNTSVIDVKIKNYENKLKSLRNMKKAETKLFAARDSLRAAQDKKLGIEKEIKRISEELRDHKIKFKKALHETQNLQNTVEDLKVDFEEMQKIENCKEQHLIHNH